MRRMICVCRKHVCDTWRGPVRGDITADCVCGLHKQRLAPTWGSGMFVLPSCLCPEAGTCPGLRWTGTCYWNIHCLELCQRH